MALPNPSTIAETREKAKKYEAKYKECKKKRESKGKKAYPEDPSTSMFVTNCHSEYNKWQDWKKRLPPPSDKPELDESALVPDDEDGGSSWPLAVLGIGGVVLILGVAYTMSR